MRKTKSKQSGAASEKLAGGASRTNLTEHVSSGRRPQPVKLKDAGPVKPANHDEPLRTLRQVLDEYRRKYADLFDLVPQPLFTLDPQGTIIEANVAAADMLCVDIVTLKGQRLDRWIVPQDRRRFNSNCLRLPAGKCCRSRKLRMKRADGCDFRVSAACAPSLDEHGDIRQVTLVLTDLGETAQPEQSLIDSERRFRSLFEACRDFIHILNVDAHILDTNRHALEKLGYDRDEFVGRRLDDFFTPDSKKRFRDNFPTLLEGGPYRQEVELICKDGRTVPVDCSASAVRNSQGRIEFCVFLQRDISDRRKVEEELLWLTRMPAENPNPVFRIAKNGVLLYANDAGKFLLAAWDCRVGYVVPDIWCRTILRALASNRGETIEMKNDGHLYSFDIAPIPGAGYVNVYGRDITQRRQAEEAMRRSRDEVTAILESIRDGFFTLDKDMTITYFNQAAERILNVRAQDVLGKRMFDQAFPEAKGTIFEEKYVTALKEKQEVDFEAYFPFEPYKNWYEVRVYPCADGLSIYFQVITERKEAEQKLRRQGQFLKNTIDSLKHPFYVINADDFTIAMANTAAVGKMQLGAHTTCYALTHHNNHPCDCRQHPCPIKMIKETHKPVVVEHAHYNKDGVLRTYEVHGYPIFDENDELKQVIEYNFDITERKQDELEREKLMQTLEAKNKELQSIVYVASHDLKTPLINIKGFGEELTEHCRKLSSLLKESVVDDVRHEIEQLLDESIPEAIDFINAGTVRINTLIDGLLQVSRLGSVEMNIKRLDMNRIIAEITEGMHFQAKDRGVRIAVEDLPECMGDPAGTRQVFCNLVNNALKYMAPGRRGKVRISGRTERGRSIYCVEDNGIGIDPLHQAKIFEVFHRLDPNDSVGGEGLGLTIVVRILERQEGEITLESEPGKGSRFFVSLPAPGM